MASRKFFSVRSSSPRCSRSSGDAPGAGGSARCSGGGPTSTCSLFWAGNGRTRSAQKKRSATALMRSQERIYTPGPNTINLQTLYSLLRRRVVVTTLRRRSRVFVILGGRAAPPLEHTSNLAEEGLLSPCLFFRLDTRRRPRGPPPPPRGPPRFR